ncbi:hypothetical protein [Apilactobacillus xinyiensis]|uniref:hypothetical protein n=1 Tax=Apilactobacillus xinyiensis TaxID=2841032 RepID=UPI003364C70A
MSFKVIRDFVDSNSNSGNHIYRKGDEYPYKQYAGAQVKDRLTELTKEDGPNDNFDGPVIEEVKD